ncbi:Hpt domain-containing protein [Hydrogenimonas cancrithermarum]|uniref:HPt domain-containing protein n=1 Tax=Hydrogenimonas cancrithermarum TaxID=2993563 RepID=A0ABN6WUW1_9BACT|nr:Hpt domain-containing protein [Hydrogenimonas cancrithermarum]BDY12628.1 hypothetical protein HCR_09400 [Hydrogenimonas cancrithermarum]
MGIRKRLEEQFDYDIVDEFLDHLDVMTEAMEPLIVALEKEEGRRERIDELFRIFHNIKSASSFLKIERVYLLAELAEETMQRLRNDPSHIGEAMVDWLLLVSDQFRTWYVQMADDGELGNINPEILNVPE